MRRDLHSEINEHSVDCASTADKKRETVHCSIQGLIQAIRLHYTYRKLAGSKTERSQAAFLTRSDCCDFYIQSQVVATAALRAGCRTGGDVSKSTADPIGTTYCNADKRIVA